MQARSPNDRSLPTADDLVLSDADALLGEVDAVLNAASARAEKMAATLRANTLPRNAASRTGRASLRPAAAADSDGEIECPVFCPAAIAAATEAWQHSEHNNAQQAKTWLEKMKANEGRRILRPLPARLDDLRTRFPNFASVTDLIESQIALQRHGVDAQSEALLLNGPPGTGKTLFAEALAEACGVELAICSLGACQGGFELTGTAAHYSTSRPGKVWELLASGKHANAVLVLDEIDKLGDTKYSPENALLDLLEARAAQRFEDQALTCRFDASRLLKIATANSLDTISEPIRSRMEIVQVTEPTPAERQELFRGMWIRRTAGLPDAPTLPETRLRELVRSGVSLRAGERILAIALGLALRDGSPEVSTLRLPADGIASPRPRPGFI